MWVSEYHCGRRNKRTLVITGDCFWQCRGMRSSQDFPGAAFFPFLKKRHWEGNMNSLAWSMSFCGGANRISSPCLWWPIKCEKLSAAPGVAWTGIQVDQVDFPLVNAYLFPTMVPPDTSQPWPGWVHSASTSTQSLIFGLSGKKKKRKWEKKNPRKSEHFWEWWLFAVSLQFYMNYLGWL